MKDQWGSKNSQWKGDNVSYKGLHKWVHSNLVKPDLCQECKQAPPYDVANTGIYNRDFINWKWLCRKCHFHSDGRYNNLMQNQAPEKRREAAYKQWATKRAKK